MKLLLLLLALPLAAHAQINWREATTNEMTAGTIGQPAAVTPRRLGPWNPGSGSATNVIRVFKQNGSVVAYPPTANTANARGLALGAAISNAGPWDIVFVQGGNYRIPNPIHFFTNDVSLWMSHVQITNALVRGASGGWFSNSMCLDIRNNNISIIGGGDTWMFGEGTTNPVQNTGMIGCSPSIDPEGVPGGFTNLYVSGINVTNTYLGFYFRHTNRMSAIVENCRLYPMKHGAQTLMSDDGTNSTFIWNNCTFAPVGGNALDATNGNQNTYLVAAFRSTGGSNILQSCKLLPRLDYINLAANLGTGSTNCIGIQTGNDGTYFEVSDCIFHCEVTNSVVAVNDISNGSTGFTSTNAVIKVKGSLYDRTTLFGPVQELDYTNNFKGTFTYTGATNVAPSDTLLTHVAGWQQVTNSSGERLFSPLFR